MRNLRGIKDLDHFEKIVEEAKARGIELCFHFDGTSNICIYSESDNEDDSTIEYDFEWHYFGLMHEILTRNYNLTPKLL